VQEAEKLGFKNIIMPADNFKTKYSGNGIKITSVETLPQAITLLLS